MTSLLTMQLLIAAVLGAASGAIGSFILLRKMALVGDALSHVALPGIGVALAYHVDPFWGVISTLLAASVAIWWLEDQTRLPVDALVALLFTASLAIGILTIPNTEIFESLFGAFPVLSPLAFGATITGSAATLVLTFWFAPPFLFAIVSYDLARAAKVGRGYELLLLVIFAVVVALGVKLVGTLLMGALTVIPAAIARNLLAGMRRYIILAAVIGAAISVVGVAAASIWGIRPGPVIILLGVGLFALSLLAEALKRRAA